MRQLNILFVTKTPPYPPVAGSAQRTAILIEALQSLGKVDLFFLGPDGMKAYLGAQGYHVIETTLPSHTKNFVWRLLTGVLGRHGDGIWRFLAGPSADYQASPESQRLIANLVKNEKYDLVVGRYLSPSAQSGMLALSSVPTIIDVDDRDSKVLTARISSPATTYAVGKLLKTRLAKVLHWEKSLWQKASMLWLCNSDDAVIAGSKPTALIQNIPYTIPDRKDLDNSDPESRIVLWVGSFNHRVNLDGINHFVDHIWPEILKLDSSAIFRIVGSGLPEKMREKWSGHKNIEVVGYAESLKPHYEAAAISIVPLEDGAGTKIKVLESLAYMRTCVVTGHSVSGYESFLRNDESIKIAKNLAGIAEAVFELISNPDLRHKLETSGRNIIENNCTRSAIQKRITDSILPLIQGQ